MKLKVYIILLILSPLVATGQYAEDFDFFWKTINEEYCYFNKKQTDWQKIKEIYQPKVRAVTNRNQFVSILEKAFNELYDDDANLNTN
jgi:hypothetical protein